MSLKYQIPFTVLLVLKRKFLVFYQSWTLTDLIF